MSRFDQYYEARDIVLDILKKDLLGPVSQDEILTTKPSDAYVMGKLYPRKVAEQEACAGRTTAADNAAMDAEAAVSLAGQFFPSSLALTFCVSEETEHIQVSGAYARYDEKRTKARNEPANESSPGATIQTQWLRRPTSFCREISLTQPGEVRLEEDLCLRVFTRPSYSQDTRVVTVALVNDATYRTGQPFRESQCVFQPYMEVRAAGERPQFHPLTRRSSLQTEDALELELLYGKTECYASGHGCSATWDTQDAGPEWVGTTFLPTFDLSQMEPAHASGEVLEMRFLAGSDDKELGRRIDGFVEGYERWAREIEDRMESLPSDLRETAAERLCACQMAAKRMRAGADMLREGPEEIRRGFRLANEAMLLQRERSVLRGGGVFKAEDAKWYPFQLGFLLYEISSFADPSFSSDYDVPDRDIADLLWFPTGGGKTEAYLGISAFVIFLRRLRNKESRGVTVIMRYTLRLLTLQQFERASIMICACEQLRKKYELGGEEIAIGLWVGESLTPNKLDGARKELRKAPGAPHENGDPVQLRVCPWCGSALSAKDYDVDKRASRMRISCPNPKCEFHPRENGLPVHLVDEAIYAHVPDFIVATIDKFAQMPLREETGRIFGIGASARPPELIIQDELHLISGQLGTIGGLYEVAVRAACEDEDGVGAKIIASTATIRGAESQIASLYGKDFAQFPPPGLDSTDLYFARPASPSARPTRRYAGIMACGAQAQPALVRVYASLLFATRYLAAAGFPDEVVDNFWTITGYFNTIRELGQSATQIVDEIQGRFRYLASRKFRTEYPGVDPSQTYANVQELTSRMDSSEITDVLQRRILRSYSSQDHRDVYDFLIATNMISVGVDVGRLGTMIMAGQPKSNAEYIQATSRIGRSNPGLVLSVYYPSRSRDRSHYEQFYKYHSALYRYVEPVSLTPFSDRARDRALVALYVALVRNGSEELRSNAGAARYDAGSSAAREARRRILEHAAMADPEEMDGIEADLDMIEELWEERIESQQDLYDGQEARDSKSLRANGAQKLIYKDYHDEGSSLLKTGDPWDPFFVMNSMRSVDEEAGIFLWEGRVDE